MIYATHNCPAAFNACMGNAFAVQSLLTCFVWYCFNSPQKNVNSPLTKPHFYGKIITL